MAFRHSGQDSTTIRIADLSRWISRRRTTAGIISQCTPRALLLGLKLADLRGATTLMVALHVAMSAAFMISAMVDARMILGAAVAPSALDFATIDIDELQGPVRVAHGRATVLAARFVMKMLRPDPLDSGDTVSLGLQGIESGHQEFSSSRIKNRPPSLTVGLLSSALASGHGVPQGGGERLLRGARQLLRRG